MTRVVKESYCFPFFIYRLLFGVISSGLFDILKINVYNKNKFIYTKILQQKGVFYGIYKIKK